MIELPYFYTVGATTRGGTIGATTIGAPTADHGIVTENQNDGTVGATLVVAPGTVVAPDMIAPDMITPTIPFPPEPPFSKIQWATRPYLGQVVGAYKSIVATACLKYHQKNQPGVWLDKIWQRSFDDRIIWSADAFDNISNYIIHNPANWKQDKFFD